MIAAVASGVLSTSVSKFMAGTFGFKFRRDSFYIPWDLLLLHQYFRRLKQKLDESTFFLCTESWDSKYTSCSEMVRATMNMRVRHITVGIFFVTPTIITGESAANDLS